MKIFKFLIVSIFFMISCSRQGSGKCSETNISTAARSSHNASRDCMKCHKDGEDGRGCFTVAGTVYSSNKTNPMTHAVVVLLSRDENDWSKITGSSKPIKTDKSGNFYTTESIDFVNKFPAIISENGDTTFMSGSLTNTAACNSCHSTSENQGIIYSSK